MSFELYDADPELPGEVYWEDFEEEYQAPPIQWNPVNLPFGVWRPSNGTWYCNDGVSQFSAEWGWANDIPVGGRYRGNNGQSTPAVFRPTTGEWFISGAPGYPNQVIQFGLPGDIPVPANYTGNPEGYWDIAVWRPSNGVWYFYTPNATYGSSYQWGLPGDVPVPGNYNGTNNGYGNTDPKIEIGVWRPSNGTWYIPGIPGIQWGLSGDIPVPGDYNNAGESAGRTDLMVWRPSTGEWFLYPLGKIATWGGPGDIPFMPAHWPNSGVDSNGVPVVEAGIWRPSTGEWWVYGHGAVQWGATGDIPLGLPSWIYQHAWTATRASFTVNPSYLFDNGTNGWYSGNALSPLNWTNCCGWPGIAYADQTGNDAIIYGPPTTFVGAVNQVFNVSVYPSGNGPHDMQLFWTTSKDPVWDAGKSTGIVSYAQTNAWANVNLPTANNSRFEGQNIQQLRLDFDNVNKGNRWHLNHMILQTLPQWGFNGSTEGWYGLSGAPAVWWTNSGWPGILVVDPVSGQKYANINSPTAPFINSNPYGFRGGSNDRLHVRIYASDTIQSAHYLWLTWISNGGSTWRPWTSPVPFDPNGWIDVYIEAGGQSDWAGAKIDQIALSVSAPNGGSMRWHIDYIGIESSSQ